MPSESQKSVVVLGATGAVGREVLLLLAGRGVPSERVRALASERSVGMILPYGNGVVIAEATRAEAFANVGLAIFAASAELSREWAPVAMCAGAVVVDNSSAFRMSPDVALVVPEINPEEATLGGHSPRIIANPNCSTIILLVALQALRARFGVRAIDVATYQAVSGAGLEAIEELRAQARAEGQSSGLSRKVFREPCAFNVFSHDSAVNLDDGLNGEERKVIDESRKIWNDPSLRVTPTCVRVPVVRAHTMAVTVQLERAAAEADVRDALHGASCVTVVDDRANNAFPTPLKATSRDDVLVGRIRPDPGAARDSAGRTDRYCLLVSSDQLRKGAATNAVQIGELIGLL